MAPYEDPDDERPPGGPPLPPDDRLWRHPSELGSLAGHAAAAVTPPDAGQRTSARAALTGVCIAGALVAVGMLLLTQPGPDGIRRPVVGRVTTSVPGITTLSTPFAAAANPVRPSQALPLATAPANRPGRLQVQVTEADGAVVVVTVHADGAAHRAGLQPDDQIVALGEAPIDSADGLSFALALTRPGDSVSLSAVRAGEPVQIQVVLG
ncbi:MAG: PDZ domain-containing protein [Acidimicrobiales bacterium]|nr:PDZ domain-containing protein [Acidimicrobiales bacterium]